MEEQKKYLTLPKKLAYGSGDFGANFFYMTVSSFVMIYLTDTIGLNAGIIGTLMMVSKLLDGVTDVFFGRLIDKTHSRMGKARPWMFYSAFPLAACLIAIFSVPQSAGQTGQYAWFFVFYTLANAVFYTANNISYSTMLALITKNPVERVSLGSFRYVFAVLSSTVVAGATTIAVAGLGGDAAAWRTISIIYAAVLLVINSISSLVCKEVPEDPEEVRTRAAAAEAGGKDAGFWKMFGMLFKNKFYILLLVIYLSYYAFNNLGTTVGVYYFQYIMGNASLLGVVSLSAFAMILGLVANPFLVKKFGMYKVNLVSYIGCSICAVGIAVAAYAANLTGIMVFTYIRSVFMGPLMGSLNAMVAETAKNFYLKNKLHAEGMMFSCSSIGIKLGSGLGTGLVGWLLAAAGYVGTAETQSAAAMNMIKFCYGALPMILILIVTLALSRMNVEDENRRLEAEQTVA